MNRILTIALASIAALAAPVALVVRGEPAAPN